MVRIKTWSFTFAITEKGSGLQPFMKTPEFLAMAGIVVIPGEETLLQLDRFQARSWMQW